MAIGLLTAGASATDENGSFAQDVADTVNAVYQSTAIYASVYGIEPGNTSDQSSKVNQMFIDAKAQKKSVFFDIETCRIDSPLYFQSGVTVDGNRVWLLNYGSGDAISIAAGSDDVHDVITGFNITYRDFLSPLNPYVPEFTLNKAVDPRVSFSWNHLPAFTGAGVRHSASGKTFKNLKTINVYLHYYGFRPCGWSYIHEDCTALACFIGFENNDAAIGGTTYPMNSCILTKCTYASCHSFGLKLRWASQVQLISVNAEKNRSDSNMDFFNCDAVTGSIYTEFARAFNAISCRGLTLSVCCLGHRDSYVQFFKTFQSIAQFSATGGGSVFTVPPYDSGTQFGITGFSAMADTNIAVLKNNKFLARTSWSKSGADITVTTPYVNGDIFHVCANAYQDWAPTSIRVDPFLMTGGTFFMRLSASINCQITGFVTGFIDGTFTINDVGFSNDTSNVWMNAAVRDTPITRASTKVVYDPINGIEYNQVFFNGITFKNISDGNLATTANATVHYPAVGVGSVTVANAHRFAFVLVSSYGSSFFTVDENGAISATGANQNKLTVQTVDAAAGGKLNIYSGTANTIRWNNLTGGAAQFQLLRITS